MSDNRFYEEFRPLVMRIALKHSAGVHEDAEEWTTEILMKALAELGKHEPFDVRAWLSRLARNYCLDQIRSRNTKKSTKINPRSKEGLKRLGQELSTETPSLEEAEEDPSEEPGEKFPYFRQLQKTEPGKAAGLERSLELVHDIYCIVSSLRENRQRMQPLLKAVSAIEECQEFVTGILGPVPPDIYRAYYTLRKTNFPLHGDPDDEMKQAQCREYEPAVRVQYELSSAKSVLDTWLWTDLSLNSFIEIPSEVADEFCSKSIDKEGDLRCSPVYSRLDLLGVRVSPLKMIYNIWHLALRKGKYQNRRLLERLLREFRDMKQGTELAYIFKPLGRDKSMESLRTKSLYGLTQITKDLAAFIFRKSFGVPADPAGLSD